MRIAYFLVLSFLVSISGFAQDSLLHISVEADAIYTSNDQVPFWFRSNQFGSKPLSGPSSSFIGRFRRDYKPNKKSLIDWGTGFEGRANLGRVTQGLLIEAYGKVRVGIFELKAGRSKDVMGLVGDSSLSSGSFSISGNALGIPKVQWSIPEYYSLPFFNKLFAIKGNFVHGWLGIVPVNKVSPVPTYFQESSLYGRIGRPDSKLQLYGGINHQAFWDTSRPVLDPRKFALSVSQEYWAVVIGKVVGNSLVGNHLGSVDLGFDYHFPGFILKAYRQNIYDINAIGHLANIKDGLNGLSFVNTNSAKKYGFQWKTFLFEMLYTKSQAGETWHNLPSGPENYYSNYQYPKGWSYRGNNLGTGFISNRTNVRKNLSTLTSDYFVNDRVQVFHIGMEGCLNDLLFSTKISYSKNFGRYETSGVPYRDQANVIRHPSVQIMFNSQDQLSTYFVCRKAFKNNVSAGLALAIDNGNLLYNSNGVQAHISKSFY
jgi:hypothetical protein